ncbi:MAG: hypothetical protein JXA11_07010 [Phycisphaerae bacterium]|nr:hypothetical protein [Phycisphaerae bacterium]
MPRKQRNELKAGIFVIASVVLLLAVILWIGASDLFTSVAAEAVFYSNISEGSLGLIDGGDVLLGDLKIGKIVSIEPDEQNKRILYHVNIEDPRYTIYADGTAIISSVLLGTAPLSVTDLGHKEKGPADEAHAIHIGGGVMQALGKLSNTVDVELNPENPDSLLSKIKSMADDLAGASKDIAAITKKLRPELDPTHEDTIAANLKTTSRNLADTTTKIDKYVKDDVGKLLVKIREIADAVLKTANNLDVSSEKIKMLLVANSSGLDEMIDNMVLVSANLKAASTEIRRNPWRLFYKPDDKKMRSTNLYDATRAFDEGANQLNIAVTKMAALRGLDPKDPETKKEIQRIRRKLLDSFTKFKKVEDVLWKEVSAE